MKHAGEVEIENVVVETDGQAPAGAAEYAHEKIAPLGRFAPRPAPYAHVRISNTGPHTIAVHANLDVNGTPVIAEAEAETVTEAIDAVRDHLQRKLTKLRN
jgi:ribosomal subunit interface protein